MASKSTSDTLSKPVGVIGAGMFGTAVANLLSRNSKVLIYARDPEKVQHINSSHEVTGYSISRDIIATNSLQEIAEKCTIMFPIVPSSGFRSVMKALSAHLHPYHILIHGTKGLDVSLPEGETLENATEFSSENVKTMSQVINEETISVRVGCLAGPNLAREILDDQPAATVIASHFDEVIDIGQKLLRSDRFMTFGNKDLIGIELAGVLKNIIAIASGALSGLGYKENARSMLISRGLIEMTYIGQVLGGNVSAFIGLAGVGDLVATCTSPLSRNFTVGYRLAQGETLQEIQKTMVETAEGINTVRIIKRILENTGRALITEAIYKVLFEDMKVEDALLMLMRSPMNRDVGIL